ncbi:MAG: 5-dehydro-2-deoxygluconokinase, partial [Actinomycetota bacterium]
FGGALSHGLLHDWSIRQIGEFANAAGAYVATKLACADAMPTEPFWRGYNDEKTRLK